MSNGFPKPIVLFSVPSGRFSAVRQASDPASSDAESNFYVAVGKDGTIRLFDVGNTETSLIKDFQGKPVTDITFSPDNRFLSWGREDGTIELYNITAEKLDTICPADKTPC